MLEIKAILPNPKGKDTNNEKIILHNTGKAKSNLNEYTIHYETVKKIYKKQGTNTEIMPDTSITISPATYGFNLANTSGRLALSKQNHIVDVLHYSKIKEGQFIQKHVEPLTNTMTTAEKTPHTPTPQPAPYISVVIGMALLIITTQQIVTKAIK